MSHPRTIWEEGRETGSEVIALGAALVLSAVTIDLLIVGRIGALFDVCFVVLSIVLALAVAPRYFFTVGVLPPLLMVTTFVLLAIVQPTALARADVGSVQAVVSGLSHHSVALVIGYVASLAVLFMRQHVQRTRIV